MTQTPEVTRQPRERQRNFRITGGRGFHIQFENGYVASVQFGGGNYCDNYGDYVSNPTSGERGSDDAEMAFWGPDSAWYFPKCLPSPGGSVYPRMSPAQLLLALNEIANIHVEVTP